MRLVHFKCYNVPFLNTFLVALYTFDYVNGIMSNESKYRKLRRVNEQNHIRYSEKN